MTTIVVQKIAAQKVVLKRVALSALMALLSLMSLEALAASIVSDSYPLTGVQPTECRLMFSIPAGEPDRTAPVEVMGDSSVRCRWDIDDLLIDGEKMDLTVTGIAIDSVTTQESTASPPFLLSVSGSPTSPAALQLDYN